ncbi:MAG: Gfo/Idh/MocA family oxidoreductase, partial [Planctomycetes bacterium]|nr:Gfo/Idh/MocA family oxidoreductase [Planctomycetota bacterium]
TGQVGKHGNIVALCDVDEEILNNKGTKFEKARKFTDFRKMLDEMGKSIDAVTVSTPDHTHAVASLRAMQMGKHVYCQKPLTHSVWEARQMRLTAEKMKVCTQMGNQGTAADGLRRAAEAVQDGIIGQVKEVHVWTNRPVWPQSPKIVARPATVDPVPSYLHWDEWLGPAQVRGYHHGNPGESKKGTYHRFNWRGWWDFGTGALGDMACHTSNMAFMALKLGYPSTIVAENEMLNPETCPGWAKVTFQFPARESMGPVKYVWYEGSKDGVTKVLPPPELVPGAKKTAKGVAVYFEDNKWMFRDANDSVKHVASGSFLIGEKAVLFSPDDYGAEAYVVADSGAIEQITGGPRRMPSNNGHDEGMKKEWITAIKADKPDIAISNFNYAAMLTETILLGNVAMKAGKLLEWDGPNLNFKNAPEANVFLKRDYRSGWLS